MFSPVKFEEKVRHWFDSENPSRKGFTLISFSIDRTASLVLTTIELVQFKDRLNESLKVHKATCRFLGTEQFLVFVGTPENVSAVARIIEGKAALAKLTIHVGIGTADHDNEAAYNSAIQAWLASKRTANHKLVDYRNYYTKKEILDFCNGDPSIGSFIVFYQPKRSVVSPHAIESHEALSRLLLKGMEIGDAIPPGDRDDPDFGKCCCFLEATRAHGLQTEFDRWLLKNVRPHLELGKSISVNMYASSINWDLEHYLIHEFPGHALAHLEIEILEHEQLTEDAISLIRRMARDYRIRFALDDFGKGVSNIEVLGRLPPNSLVKVDQSFVRADKKHPPKEIQSEVQRAAILLAKAYGLNIAFEGVENEMVAAEVANRLSGGGYKLESAFLQGWFLNGQASPALHNNAHAMPD